MGFVWCRGLQDEVEMQQSHESRLCLGRQQVADLSDNAPLRRGAAPIRRKIVQETVVIIERGNQVRAGKNVARGQVVENSPRLGYLVRYTRIHFRVGYHVEARRTRDGTPPLGTVSFRRLSEPTGYQNESRQLEKLRRHAQADSRSPMGTRSEHVSKPARILASFPFWRRLPSVAALPDRTTRSTTPSESARLLCGL